MIKLFVVSVQYGMPFSFDPSLSTSQGSVAVSIDLSFEAAVYWAYGKSGRPVSM